MIDIMKQMMIKLQSKQKYSHTWIVSTFAEFMLYDHN